MVTDGRVILGCGILGILLLALMTFIPHKIHATCACEREHGVCACRR